ncbi:MAG: glycoside hydrolase family 97 N-terminal domain-containing protein, partial [Prevotella sp.]|nr:glycoside hydrolase family 97 N-terminal domain-containing protein [Prevotella sp.]
MKKALLLFLALTCLTAKAGFAPQLTSVQSPDGRVMLSLELKDQGKPHYRVLYDGQEIIQSSPLGIITNIGDFTQGLNLTGFEDKKVKDTYSLRNIKQSQVDYEATEAVATYALTDKPETNVLEVVFRVSNRDVAFRYRILPQKETRACVVESEASSFVLPDGTTTFLCPQSKPMGGFARTSPSYETPYTLDEPVGKNGWGEGYTFPCLFKIPGATGNSGASCHWLLLSETGTDGNYVGCRLLNDGGGKYRIGFPQAGELNSAGATSAAMALPGETPWRTITVGPLANIVETTAAFDLVQPKYKASQAYVYGKGSWSWIIGMDPSCNFDEQKRYIDFSAAMGYQSVLIDAFWDQQIGYEKIAELARYGREKGVGL